MYEPAFFDPPDNYMPDDFEDVAAQCLNDMVDDDGEYAPMGLFAWSQFDLSGVVMYDDKVWEAIDNVKTISDRRYVSKDVEVYNVELLKAKAAVYDAMKDVALHELRCRLAEIAEEEAASICDMREYGGGDDD